MSLVGPSHTGSHSGLQVPAGLLLRDPEAHASPSSPTSCLEEWAPTPAVPMSCPLQWLLPLPLPLQSPSILHVVGFPLGLLGATESRWARVRFMTLLSTDSHTLSNSEGSQGFLPKRFPGWAAGFIWLKCHTLNFDFWKIIKSCTKLVCCSYSLCPWISLYHFPRSLPQSCKISSKEGP